MKICVTFTKPDGSTVQVSEPLHRTGPHYVALALEVIAENIKDLSVDLNGANVCAVTLQPSADPHAPAKP